MDQDNNLSVDMDQDYIPFFEDILPVTAMPLVSKPLSLTESFALVKDQIKAFKSYLQTHIPVLAAIKAVTADNLKESRKALSLARQRMDSVDAFRMEQVARPIAQFNKEAMAVQKEVCNGLQTEFDRVKRLADDFEVESARQANEARKEALAALPVDPTADPIDRAIQAQAAIQQTGSVNIKPHLITATVNLSSAYLELLRQYLIAGGDLGKLDFLISFACKQKPRPEIKGLIYNI